MFILHIFQYCGERSRYYYYFFYIKCVLFSGERSAIVPCVIYSGDRTCYYKYCGHYYGQRIDIYLVHITFTCEKSYYSVYFTFQAKIVHIFCTR